MRLRHFSGRVVELDLVGEDSVMFRCGDGDPFDSFVFRMMFDLSMSGTVVEMSAEERVVMETCFGQCS